MSNVIVKAVSYTHLDVYKRQVYGRDVNGPTAVLKSVSKLDKCLTSNGGLLNMKFLPEFFRTQSGIDKFARMLRTFVELEIPRCV